MPDDDQDVWEWLTNLIDFATEVGFYIFMICSLMLILAVLGMFK